MLRRQRQMCIRDRYSNECNVIAIKQSKIKDIVNSRTSEDDDIYYATLESFYMSESGEEKSSKNDVALFAKDMTDAKAKLDSYMKQGLSDMAVVKIVQTKFLDVIPCSIGANGENWLSFLCHTLYLICNFVQGQGGIRRPCAFKLNQIKIHHGRNYIK